MIRKKNIIHKVKWLKNINIKQKGFVIVVFLLILRELGTSSTNSINNQNLPATLLANIQQSLKNEHILGVWKELQKIVKPGSILYIPRYIRNKIQKKTMLSTKVQKV